MATDLVTIATTAVLSQFLGPSAKHLGEQLLERGKRVGAKAAAMLTAVGREPQAVEPKVLLPLVQAASLETDASLSDKWAALLANAADPAQRVAVQPGFAEVLRQLTPTDARVLEAAYFSKMAPPGTTLTGRKPVKQVMEETGFDFAVISISVDNLLRLRLCMVPASDRAELPNEMHLPTPSEVGTTVFGTLFLRSVTPPAS